MTYLIEFYAKSPDGIPGWEIFLAKTQAASLPEAEAKVSDAYPISFDCIITSEQIQPDFLPSCECVLIP